MPFRVLDNLDGEKMIDVVEKEALKIEGTPWKRNQHGKRAKWLFQRLRLNMIKNLAAFEAIDYIESAFVPQDDTPVNKWFNDCNSRSNIPDNGARLDLNSPIKINMILVQDKAM